MSRWVITVLLVSAALGVLFWRFGPMLFTEDPEKDPVLTVWIFAEDENYIKPVIEDFLLARPNVKITLVTQTHLNYYPRLKAQLSSGRGPDIFPIHSSNLALLSEDLSAAPDTIITIDEFSKTYYPIARQTLTADNKIYGLPSEIDGLNLFVNEEILKAGNASIPASWGDFIESSKKVTVKDSSGVIQTAGAALGSTTNVDFWPEIVALLFLEQPRGSLSSPNNSDGAEVLRFYSNFVTDPRNKTWDSNLPPSGTQFAQGKLAFYFGGLSSASEIKLKNPNLGFKSIPIPQLPGKKVGYGFFWGYGVSKRSAFQYSAWELNKYLSSPGVLQKINDKRSLSGALPKAYPRVEMASLQQNDPILGAQILQSPVLQGWYLNSFLNDGGISDEITNAYKLAIDDTLKGSDPASRLLDLNNKVAEILKRYNYIIILK